MRVYSVFGGMMTMLVLTLWPTPVLAADTPPPGTPPDAMSIVEKMKEVFEPEVPRVATVTVTLHTEGREQIQWVGRQAGKETADGKRTLVVMLEPQDVKGTAYLMVEREEQRDAIWTYMPPVDRIRKLVPLETYQLFLGTDFTYADLGFVSRQGTYRLLGEETHREKRAYKIEFVPQEQWFYSRIITWVDADSFLPLQRDYYDTAQRLWKTQLFEQVLLINDRPTPLRIEMRDVQQGTRTTFTMSDVEYNRDIPDTLFDPTRLRVAAAQAPRTVASGE